MKNSRIRIISYIALYSAIYIVLKWVGNLIPFLQMPNGGSIELELIAVFIASYHMGWKFGFSVAMISWLLSIVLGFPMYFVQPIQVLLDYVLPLAVCGMASVLWPFKNMHRTGIIIMAVMLGAGTFFGIVNSWGQSALIYAVSALLAAAVAGFIYWYLGSRKRFGIVLAMLLKYLFQVLSGVYFWFPEGSAAGSTAAWVFSAGYNLWFNLVTLAVCMIAVPVLIDRLQKADIHFIA